MTKPYFEPQADGLFSIVHNYDREPINLGSGDKKANIAKCQKALKEYPYDFEAASILGKTYAMLGDIEKACQVRYDAFGYIVALVGDMEIELDWENEDNQDLLQLLSDTALDHFLINDFEMSAAMLELLLDLDPEDHMEATRLLVYCYIELEEWELLEDAMIDVSDKSPEKLVQQCWASFKQNKLAEAKTYAQEIRKKLPAIFEEFTGEDHDVTTEYLVDIENDSPSKATRARELWLQTENIWNETPEFITFLKENV